MRTCFLAIVLLAMAVMAMPAAAQTGRGRSAAVAPAVQAAAPAAAAWCCSTARPPAGYVCTNRDGQLRDRVATCLSTQPLQAARVSTLPLPACNAVQRSNCSPKGF